MWKCHPQNAAERRTNAFRHVTFTPQAFQDILNTTRGRDVLLQAEKRPRHKTRLAPGEINCGQKITQAHRNARVSVLGPAGRVAVRDVGVLERGDRRERVGDLSLELAHHLPLQTCRGLTLRLPLQSSCCIEFGVVFARF